MVINMENSSKHYTTYHHNSGSVIYFFIFYSKVLIDDRTRKNRVQIFVKLSTEIDPKIFILWENLQWLQACGDFVAINL